MTVAPISNDLDATAPRGSTIEGAHMADGRKGVPRKHHYVPQFYLRGFADAENQLFTVDAKAPRCFNSSPEGIAAERDFNRIDAEGVPPDALEKEIAKLEGAIAPSIQRVRSEASFGQDSVYRDDIINLITLLAVRNPRKRKDMDCLLTGLFQAMISMPFESKERWEAVVAQMKEGGQWPKDAPTDFEGHKKFVEENKDKLRPHKNLQLEMELDQLTQMYPYFDARRWRILKAGEETGGFVTTDHPVCVHRSGEGINYGQQFAPGYGLSDQNILFSLSPTVALIGRLEGEEDMIEANRHCVASVNATIMGYAMRQIYARDDQFYYTRPVGQDLGRGSKILQDPHLAVREE